MLVMHLAVTWALVGLIWTVAFAAATVGALVLAAIFLVPKKAASPPKAPPKRCRRGLSAAATRTP